MNFIPFQFYLLSFFQLFSTTAADYQRGVYVLTFTSANADESKVFKLPNDTVFVNKSLIMEKVLGIEQLDFYGQISTLYKYNFFVVDLKKGLFKEIGEDLEKDTKSVEWKELKSKATGITFYHEWMNDEPYTLKDSIYEGKKVKKLSFTSKSENVKWEAILVENPPKNAVPTFYYGLEDKFKAKVIYMRGVYPDNIGIATYTKKFIPLKDHKVLRRLDKCLLE